MAETTWVNGVTGSILSTEILHAANTAINVYGYTVGDDLTIQKKGPNGKFYPHKMKGDSKIGGINSSAIILTPGTYRIIGNSKNALYITYEVI